jgi:hypothetical protein
MRRAISLAPLLVSLVAAAATPPPQVNLQGVLRSDSDAPLAGAYDVAFAPFHARTGTTRS